jgi:hypothetical protein
LTAAGDKTAVPPHHERMMPERRPTRLQSTILPGQGTEDDKDFELP